MTEPAVEPTTDAVVNGDRRPVTDAILRALRAHSETLPAPFPIEEGDVPPGETIVDVDGTPEPQPDVTKNPERPYLIVWSLPGGRVGGPPLVDPEADVTWTYQLTAVGDNLAQAEWCRDQAHRVMVGRNGDGSYRHGMIILNADETPAPIEICDRAWPEPGGPTPSNGTVAVSETYEISTTPITEGIA